MLTTNGTNITITRGDSAYINVVVTDSEGHDYVVGPNDVVRAQVRQDATSSNILFETIIPSDTMVWHIKPEDTEGANMGRTYVYDVQLETADGDVFTFIPLSNFTVSKEVTRRAGEQ